MKKRIILLSAIVVAGAVIRASAHPGSTDFKGGHYDRSTGEYHYHHGYGAHKHYDMDGDGVIDCPFNFDDRTSANSGSSGSYESYNAKPSTDKPTIPRKESADTKKSSNLRNTIGLVAYCAVIGCVFITEFIHSTKGKKSWSARNAKKKSRKGRGSATSAAQSKSGRR